MPAGILTVEKMACWVGMLGEGPVGDVDAAGAGVVELDEGVGRSWREDRR